VRNPRLRLFGLQAGSAESVGVSLTVLES